MTSNPRLGKLQELNPIADDGDELNFCSTCAFGAVCLAAGLSKPALHELHMLVDHGGPFRAGDAIFKVGESFATLFALRSGMVKTRLVDDSGREQVLGFHLPGEMIGLDAIHPARYPCDAIALDTVFVCRFSFPALAALATKLPEVQQQLFDLLSAGIGNASRFAGDHTAEERLAAFLLDLAGRYAARGFSPHRFQLTMARADIANLLRLAAETVSRVLRRFQDRTLIRVNGRSVELIDLPGLRQLARPILHT